MDSDRKNTRIVRHQSADEFLANCGGWLSEQEDLHNGVLSLAHALGSGKHIHKHPFIFAHMERNGEIVGCAIFAEPDGITLSEMPVDVADKFFVDLKSDIQAPSRIHGPRQSANQLADHYAVLTDSMAALHSEWNVYRLDASPTQLQTAKGTVRIGNQSDGDIVRAWGKLYDVEKPANVNIEKFLIRKLEDGLLYFWVDQKPKALLTLSGVNCSGNRISSVFTPEKYRGKGYATSLVQEMSADLLGSGKTFVTLNTEIGDAAERIYEKLGYYIVGERVSFTLNPATPA